MKGRVFVVTGASSGIGRDVVRHLAGAGAALVAVDIEGEGLKAARDEVEERWGSRVVTVVGDLTDPRVAEESLIRAVEDFGGLDGVVSNAGIGAPGAIVDLSLEEWNRSLAVNTTSHFLIARKALAILTQQGRGGSLVFVASKNALSPGKGFGAYSCAKAAEVQLAKIVAIEGAPHQIRSNIVNPDAVFSGSHLWSDELRAQRAAAHGVPAEKLEEFYADRNLLHSNVDGTHVAEAVEFFLSDRSSRTTGCILTVDGGIEAAFPR